MVAIFTYSVILFLYDLLLNAAPSAQLVVYLCGRYVLPCPA
jgi:hypothetical protein